MNDYLKNLEKIEFVLTYACTGRCKHCSEGDHDMRSELIDPDISADAVRKIASAYDIKTVMVFGGEPMLHTDAVFKIMEAAKQMNVPKRQVITNGFFSSDTAKIRDAANALYECGVNDLLLSVDAFHQEFIPIDTVRIFAREVIRAGVPIRLQPAWVVSPDDDNPYNRRTKELLDSFMDMGLVANGGNVVFAEGNALKNLAQYFVGDQPENPYTEDPCNVKCISFEPNGDVLCGNMYRDDIMKIIESYSLKERKEDK
jgi:MoaA/NifB/PqqE/SkfB family radical SAM enzyme